MLIIMIIVIQGIDKSVNNDTDNSNSDNDKK